MNGLSLFSGIGGIDVAVKLVLPDVKTIAYVEKDASCQTVLRARMADGSLDAARIIDDIRNMSDMEAEEPIDIIFGGFPCQPFSLAGKRKEADDDRNLWPEFINTITTLRPRYVFLENVPGILTSKQHEPYILTILADLYQGGYDAEWGTFKASDIGAPHKRERWFCLAWRRDLAATQGRESGKQKARHWGKGSERGSKELADSHQEGLQGGFGYDSGKEREDGTSVEHDRNDIRSETGRSSRTLGNPTSGWTGELQDKSQTSWASSSDVNSSGTSGTLGDTIDTGDTSPRHGANRHRQTQEQDEQQLSFAEPTGSDFDVADPTSERGERWRTGIEGKYTQSKEGVSGWGSARELADTDSQRAQGSASGEHSAKQRTHDAIEELADTHVEGLQGIRLEDQGEPCETGGALLQCQEFIEHEFPPGPSDYEGWARVLSEMPEVEPSFCIEADGISKSLVISRSQSLKMLGNSVVPQQVAAALVMLWERMEG